MPDDEPKFLRDPAPARPAPSAETDAQRARKRRSIVMVTALGLPVIDHLPVLPDESEIEPRTTDEVVARCVACEVCALKGDVGDPRAADRLIDAYGVRSAFSPREMMFLWGHNNAPHDRAQFAWRYECVHALLWALGYLPELHPAHVLADVLAEGSILLDRGPKGFGEQAMLRSAGELLDQADLYYRLHWAARHLRLRGETHDKLHEGVVVERRRALDWLIGPRDRAWDDVRLDT